MALVTKRELKQLLHPHYIIELLLAFSYIILKKTPWTAVRVFGTSEFSSRDTELFIFTFILIAFKTRKRGHVDFLPYLTSACSMAKIGNLLLFSFSNTMYGMTYIAVLFGHMLLLPKPTYKGPDNITYFLGDEFEKELTKDKSVKWLVEFYESWNPDCVEFAGIFKELSAKFATNDLKFAKINVSRSPKMASKYNVISSVTSRTLPTVILFKNGREHARRPLLNSRNRLVPFSFTFENIVSVFNLP